MAALRKLAAWWELLCISRLHSPFEVEESCPNKEVGLSPPAPCRKGRRSARSTLEPVNAGKAADVASAAKRRGSAHRAASEKGGGR